MSTNYYLSCIQCKSEFDAKPMYKCPKCNGILNVRYKSYTKERMQGLKQDFIFHDGVTESMLGEGDTPLVPLDKTTERLGVKNVFGKCEYLNPTGSFKDRPVAAGMKKALEFGYEKVIVASSGNGAASVAAYAAKLSLSATILVPESTPAEKVKQSQFYGANVIKIKGSYSNSFELALNISEKGEAYNLTTTFINPYTIEGDKGVAYEVNNQLQEWPDYVIVPIGAGPLLVGIYKGFQELMEVYGYTTNQIPRMIGIQSEGCSPIAKAFQNNKEHVIAENNPQTVAGGIGDGLRGYTEDGTFTLDIIRKSNGLCLEVSDEEILSAQQEMAINEGIFIEPSAAASLAGLRKLTKRKGFTDASFLLLLTGHGLKDMKSIGGDKPIPCIEPNMNELIRLI